MTKGLRVLFWNVRGQGCGANEALDRVPELIIELQPDIVTLAEASPDAEAKLKSSLQYVVLATSAIEEPNPRRLLTFGLGERNALTERTVDRHHRAYEVIRDGYDPLLIIAVHLRSPLYDKVDPTRARIDAERSSKKPKPTRVTSAQSSMAISIWIRFRVGWLTSTGSTPSARRFERGDLELPSRSPARPSITPCGATR